VGPIPCVVNQEAQQAVGYWTRLRNKLPRGKTAGHWTRFRNKLPRGKTAMYAGIWSCCRTQTTHNRRAVRRTLSKTQKGTVFP
jgi:hypothetical protein